MYPDQTRLTLLPKVHTYLSEFRTGKILAHPDPNRLLGLTNKTSPVNVSIDTLLYTSYTPAIHFPSESPSNTLYRVDWGLSNYITTVYSLSTVYVP